MTVTDKDREFAAQILEDFAEFEEGIEDQEKMAQWVRNVRKAAIACAIPPAPRNRLSPGDEAIMFATGHLPDDF